MSESVNLNNNQDPDHIYVTVVPQDPEPKKIAEFIPRSFSGQGSNYSPKRSNNKITPSLSNSSLSLSINSLMPRQSNFSVESKLDNDRKNFLIKVYTLLSLELILTITLVSIVITNSHLQEGIKQTTPLFVVSLVIFFLLVFGIMCCKKIARKYPYNYISLFIFNIFGSYIIAYISAFYDPYTVLCASIISFSVSISLTVYSWKSKKNATVCGGIVLSLLISLSLFGIFMIFFYQNYSNLIICELAIICYSIFIVYDSQLIAGGRYKEITLDDYIIATLILYVDVFGLFLYVLSLISSKN